MKDRDQNTANQQESTSSVSKQDRPRSSAFNEPGPDAQKSNSNDEDADLEQERKEAMTERD